MPERHRQMDDIAWHHRDIHSIAHGITENFTVTIFNKICLLSVTTACRPSMTWTVFIELHDQLASLTRCFSAVAELLVTILRCRAIMSGYDGGHWPTYAKHSSANL